MVGKLPGYAMCLIFGFGAWGVSEGLTDHFGDWAGRVFRGALQMLAASLALVMNVRLMNARDRA